jgi:hypothetical protein
MDDEISAIKFEVDDIRAAELTIVFFSGRGFVFIARLMTMCLTI